MKLLLITQSFPPDIGGIQTYAYEHAVRWNKVAEWFAVMCPDRSDAESFDRTLEFPVFRIRSWKRIRFLPLLWELPKLLIRQKVDAVFHAQWQLATASLIARKFGLIQHVFIAVHRRELLVNSYSQTPLIGRLYTLWKKWVFREADHFYPISDYIANRLNDQGVGKKRMTIVINGTNPKTFFPMDVSALKKELGIGNKKILITVSRLDTVKGLDLVIKALPEIKKEVPDVHYLIAGRGPEEKKLRALAEQLNILDSVTFLGSIPYTGLNRYYNLGDVFIMPSLTIEPHVEGFGIVFLEANACELPVLGSDSGGIPSAIVHDKTGVIVPDGNPQELVRQTVRLLKDEDLRKKMGRVGRERVLREANWDVLNKILYEDMKRWFSST